ncbi:MAG: hypothetical protein M3271_03280, partial [Actinomycetota bacterium]|nr:hypothetical protein [Actinomycetota bacterium]
MRGIEQRVRRELQRLDGMEMPDRLPAIRRNAARQRLTRIVATGAAIGVLALTTVWGAGIMTPSDDAAPVKPAPRPSESTRTFGRYTISLGGGFDSSGKPIEGSGTVEIDSQRGTACFQAHILGATSAHLHGEDDDTTVVLFDAPDRYRPEMCARDQSSDVLQSIIDRPESFYVEFHNEASGGVITSSLAPHGSMASCPAETPPFLTDTGTAFRPRSTLREDGRRVMPVVFPDGSTVELVYPPNLRLQELAARPDTSGGAPGKMVRAQISHGGISFRVSGPVDCVEGPDGSELPVWRWKGRQDVLIVRFG